MDNRFNQEFKEDIWYQAYYFDQPLPYDIMINGRIRSRYSRAKYRELGTSINSWGYATYRLRINDKSYHRFVHTILMHTFKPLPQGYDYDQLTVNHIDGNKTNNHISNLEWCTFTANQIHKFDYKLQKATRGKVDHNVYLFRHDDGREFTGTPRQFYHKFRESDGIYQQGVRNIVKGYNMSNGHNVTQHLGWRKIELVKTMDQSELEKALIYEPLPKAKTTY